MDGYRRPRGTRARCLSLLSAIVATIVLVAGGHRQLMADLEMPIADPSQPIRVSGVSASRWRHGQYEVWHLVRPQLSQGEAKAKSQEAILWVQQATAGQMGKVVVYLEGKATVDFGRAGTPHRASGRRAQSVVAPHWLSRFQTTGHIRLDAPLRPPARTAPPIYARAMTAWQRDRGVVPAQFTAPFVPPGAAGANPNTANPNTANPNTANPNAVVGQNPPAGNNFVPQPARTLQQTPQAQPQRAMPDQAGSRGQSFQLGNKIVTMQGRGDAGFQLQIDPGLVPDETIARVTQGVQITVENLEFPELGAVGTVNIEADRLVIWTGNVDKFNQQKSPGTQEIPFEVYLEGNVVFQQGERVIYADQMYYDVQRETGMVLNADVLTPVQRYQGLLRLKADVLRQMDRQNFVAYGAALTGSRLAVPGYWFQSQVVQFRDDQRIRNDPFAGNGFGNDVIPNPQFQNSAVNAPVRSEIEHHYLARSSSNFLYVAGLPVFYWPVMATDLSKPSYYIDRFSIRSDSVFGNQVLVDFDAYQLFGVQNRLEGTDWTLSTDLLSERGFGVGTNVQYQRNALFGFPGRYQGMLDAWGIKDGGLDNLGADRRALVPETEWRGRVLGRHRHFLPNGFQISSELGVISDRNFLEQYYELEWDQFKDQRTGTEIKRYVDNRSWSVAFDTRPNDFFTDTEWLPRVDHFTIAQSLLGRLSWYEHSQVGYARLRTATAPSDPVDAAKYRPLAWEVPAEGIRAATRHELNLPLAVGPVQLVPFVGGELAYWKEDLTFGSATRALGQAGIRASTSLWKSNTNIKSTLLNVDGLAHKVEWQTEFLVAESNEEMLGLPLFDALDDNSAEHYRRRYFFDTFGGVGANIPLKFDERTFALRSGVQRWVASPTTEIADDLMQARVGLYQRWQTKRGLPGRRRIVDLVVLNVEGILFPKSDRDNFGQEAGLANYDFRWHVGDRVTLMSDGYADFFGDGLRTVSFGGLLSRPEVGSLYLGYQSLEGPISSSIVSASLTYRMSAKWIASATTAFDLGATGNIGQTLAVTRVGESALIRMGVNVDESRGNLGVQFAIEPRFLPSSRLGRVGGIQIPPAGARGLE